MPLVSMAALIAGARASRVVSFPTDTVPALAVTANNAAEIFRIKQRDKAKPLILMATCLADFLPFIEVDQQVLDIWQTIAEQYWPGALTLILPANSRGQSLNEGSLTLGLRIPKEAVAIAILQQTGPLLTTSANKSGQPPLRKMAEIAQAFPEVCVLGSMPEKFDLYADTGSGLPSTVVEWIDSGWQVRRQGQVILPNM